MTFMSLNNVHNIDVQTIQIDESQPMKNILCTIIITKLWPMKFVMEWGMQKHNNVFITNHFPTKWALQMSLIFIYDIFMGISLNKTFT